MRLTIRTDSKNPAHVRFTVFANGGNCGILTMRVDEFRDLQSILRAGAGPAQSLIEFKSEIRRPDTCVIEDEKEEVEVVEMDLDLEDAETQIVEDFFLKEDLKEPITKSRGGDKDAKSNRGKVEA